MAHLENIYLPGAAKVAAAAAGVLLKEGKGVVLEHLISQLTVEKLKGLSPEGRKTLIHALQRFEDFLEPSTLEARRQAFCEKYLVVAHDAPVPKVAFRIPEGANHLELITEANLLIEALYNRRGTCIEFGKGWSQDVQLNEVVTDSRAITVDGYAAGGQDTISVDLRIRDLAAGHLAFHALTGRDLWGGRCIFGIEGTIEYFSDYGLAPVD